MRRSLHLAAAIACAIGGPAALSPTLAQDQEAGALPPKITYVSVRPDAEERVGHSLYHFRVTILHEDTGWDNYVEAWEIIGPDGEVLGERPFFEPKPGKLEQLTALSGVIIPTEVETVEIRARHYPEGYSGEAVQVNLPR